MSKTTEISPAIAEPVSVPVRTVIENVKGERVYLACPDYVSDTAINLSENSVKVLEKRYLRRDYDGSLLETPAGMFYRVAYHIAQVEAEHGGDAAGAARTFYDLLAECRFFPNSPTFTGAGTPLGQLAACFVLPIDDDMGKESDGIFSTLRVAALIQQTGGGNGFSFTPPAPQERSRPYLGRPRHRPGRLLARLRPGLWRDRPGRQPARGQHGRAARGPSGHRRVHHLQGQEEGKITNFNISVGHHRRVYGRPSKTTPISTCATRATARSGAPCAPAISLTRSSSMPTTTASPACCSSTPPIARTPSPSV